jgi:hypothetical protein
MAQSGPAFQSISTPLGDSPFDKGLCSRDKIVSGFIKKINRLNVEVAEGQEVLLSDAWGDEVISLCETTFPGLGGFASGGGPLR